MRFVEKELKFSGTEILVFKFGEAHRKIFYI